MKHFWFKFLEYFNTIFASSFKIQFLEIYSIKTPSRQLMSQITFLLYIIASHVLVSSF